MPNDELFNFLETYNVMTYGLRGRRVALESNRVCWIRKNGERIPINDWSAALEQAGHDKTKEALITMGAVVLDQSLRRLKWIPLAKWTGKCPIRLLDGTKVVSVTQDDDGRYILVNESGVTHYGSKEVLVQEGA